MNWWLHSLIAIMCEKANETQMKKDLASIQGFSIQMSLFLYLLNMSIIIRISYPEKSSRVQSCSWHVWLIKWNHEISISLLLSWHWWNWFEFLLETFVICFAKYHGILNLNVICLVCKAFLIHTFYSNKSPCFSPINWDCIKWLILIMQISSMLLSLFALSDPVGDYSFTYIMTKKGSSMW